MDRLSVYCESGIKFLNIKQINSLIQSVKTQYGCTIRTFKYWLQLKSISARVQPTNICPPPQNIDLHVHLTSFFGLRIMRILLSYVLCLLT